MAIHVHRCDNFDVSVERISISPDSKEKFLLGGSSRWDQRIVVEYVCRHKQARVRVQSWFQACFWDLGIVDDFEDEVYFKQGRVVTSRFSYFD